MDAIENKRDWTSFIIIALFLCFHLLIAGYPVIEWDSARYLYAAMNLSTDPKGLTLLSNLLFPLARLTGAWAFPIFQITLLSYVLVSFLKFFNKNFLTAVIAITISGAGYFAIKVMMDIYTAVGILALFLILNDRRDILLYIILGLCYIAHYENLFLFPLCAGAYWLIFKRKDFKSMVLPILIIFIIGVSGIVLVHYYKEGKLRLFPNIKNTILAVSVMASSDEVVRSYMEKYPDSVISKYKGSYEDVVKSKWDGDRVQALLWGETGLGKLRGKDSINREAKEFISYAVKNYKFVLIKDVARNTFLFFVKPGAGVGGEHGKLPIQNFIKKGVPWQFQEAQHSLQYREKLSVIPFEWLYLVSFCLTFPVITFFMILSFFNNKIKDSVSYSFVIFVIIVMLVNAFLMSNFSGIFLRYQLRTLLLPALAAVLAIAQFEEEFFPKCIL